MELTKTVTAQDVIDSELFVLTGSRYIANKYPGKIDITNCTDWDFCCDISDTEALCWLAEHQLRPVTINTAYPLDDLADAVIIGNGFQIIVRVDSAKYMRVLDSISLEFYTNYLWKSGPKQPNRDQIQSIFNQLYLTIDG